MAIHRAYGTTLTATTLLPDKESLLTTYPSAHSVLETLETINACTVLYGVDATQLHNDSRLNTSAFDYILFHHPHLGYQRRYSDEEDSNRANTKSLYDLHTQLLKGYLASAQNLLRVDKNDHKKNTGFLHLCLCGKERDLWKLDTVLEELDLQLVYTQPASRPLLDHSSPAMRKHTRTRRGHWLGRFGYRHQPTDPTTTHFVSNVSNSVHYFIQPKTKM